ncbi:RES family NAD+ phosphorylase [Oryzibacter oryziterrae]|uniref:RES family NAD+ phosphorylase n=1 Tax=Oryzibacter oryziterrae TaxID=2766474 RepID=UPI001F40F1A3|nr:RES family NAD+ phosphorylase [Oryzibacter oryziterrae]
MPETFVDWPRAYRIIASRYPPIDLFERLTPDPAVWDALIALEMLTNPRVRDEAGQITLVPADERVSGPGASYVMASFTHLNPKGSRFSDGSYGVYYAAADFETALRETVFHFEAFARDSGDPIRDEDMRVLVGTVANAFEDATSLTDAEQAAILAPDSYGASQAYARKLREAGSNGILYPSVRNAGGLCVAAFKPIAVGIPTQERHIQYHWDGQRVTRYFDYATQASVPVATL